MRKLASIQKITNIRPIDGSDFIEQGTILGWNVVVKKDEFKNEDMVVFIEPDSILPELPEFEFLRKNKFRIKTQKIRKVLSQGICFPISILPQDKQYSIDEDVTSILKIKKYEPYTNNDEVNNTPTIKKYKNPFIQFLLRFKIFRILLLPVKKNGGFPDFLSKTDETRCQNIPFILSNKNIKFVGREKIDGSSCTVFLHKTPRKFFWEKQNFDFGVCSRNLRLPEDDSNFWRVAKKYNLKEVLMDLIGENDFVAIQGEVIAPKIQGNKYKVTESDLYVFNLIYPDKKVSCLDGEIILNKYGIKWCPLVVRDYVLPDAVEDLLNFATGKSKLYDTLREGVVFRNYEYGISFKAVSPDFLIKNDE